MSGNGDARRMTACVIEAMTVSVRCVITGDTFANVER